MEPEVLWSSCPAVPLGPRESREKVMSRDLLRDVTGRGTSDAGISHCRACKGRSVHLLLDA